MLYTEIELQKIFYKNKKIKKYNKQVSKIRREAILSILQNFASKAQLSLFFHT